MGPTASGSRASEIWRCGEDAERGRERQASGPWPGHSKGVARAISRLRSGSWARCLPCALAAWKTAISAVSPDARRPAKRASAFSHSPARSHAAMAADHEKAFGSSCASRIAPSSPMTRSHKPSCDRAAMADEYETTSGLRPRCRIDPSRSIASPPALLGAAPSRSLSSHPSRALAGRRAMSSFFATAALSFAHAPSARSACKPRRRTKVTQCQRRRRGSTSPFRRRRSVSTGGFGHSFSSE